MRRAQKEVCDADMCPGLWDTLELRHNEKRYLNRKSIFDIDITKIKTTQTDIF